MIKRRKVISVIIVMAVMISCAAQIPVKLKAQQIYGIEEYSDDDYEIEDSVIYAKKSVTKYAGDELMVTGRFHMRAPIKKLQQLTNMEV